MVIHNTDVMSEDFVEELEVHDSHKQGISKRKTREMMGTDYMSHEAPKKKRHFRDSIRNTDWSDTEE